LGATETVDWLFFEKTTDAITALKSKGYKVYAIEQVENSISLQNFPANNEAIAVVLVMK